VEYRYIATSCSDRFGEYGIIGFASVESRQNSLFLKDFVLSCRVARRNWKMRGSAG